jgi:hypothetical protein
MSKQSSGFKIAQKRMVKWVFGFSGTELEADTPHDIARENIGNGRIPKFQTPETSI